MLNCMHLLNPRSFNKLLYSSRKKLTRASLYLRSITKRILILTPRHRRSSCCTGRRRRSNRLGIPSSALLLLSPSISSLCALFTLCCSSLVALSTRKALCSRQVAVRAKYSLKTQSSTMTIMIKITITINEATP